MADADTLRKHRQQQLEEKRKRLEDLRKRRQEKTGPGTEAAADGYAGAGVAAAADTQQQRPQQQQADDLEALIKGLLSAPAQAQDGQQHQMPAAAAAAVQQGNTGTLSTPVAAAPSSSATPAPELSVVRGLAVRHVFPTVREMYDKECQTDLDTYLEEPPDSGPLAVLDQQDARNAAATGEAATGAKGANAEGVDAQAGDSTTALAKKPLGQGAKEHALASDSFAQFLRRTGTLVERALAETQTFDLLRDYAATDAGDRALGGRPALHKLLKFHDAALCADRAVTDVHWSPHYPELLLVAYSAPGRGQSLESCLLSTGSVAPAAGAADGAPDGLVLVWSLALPTRPEFVLHAQSAILSARFHDFDAQLVVGGSYSGQVVTWDLKATALPVQQTALAPDAAHTRPIFGMAMEGTGSAHALVTASTDGKVAWWNPRQLAQPNEVLQLSLATAGDAPGAHQAAGASSAAGTGLAVSCIACVPGETVQLLVGLDSGGILAAAVHTHGAGVRSDLRGHFGMVTALDTHPGKGRALSDLVLSSSLDWTTRLWSLRRGGSPLMTFSHDSYDYVCDVRWSPVHPALFATANVAGELALWNLMASLDAPVVPPCKVSGGSALTKLAWSGEGYRLAVGDVSGVVHVHAVADEIAAPRHDEEHRLERLLHELTNTT